MAQSAFAPQPSLAPTHIMEPINFAMAPPAASDNFVTAPVPPCEIASKSPPAVTSDSLPSQLGTAGTAAGTDLIQFVPRRRPYHRRSQSVSDVTSLWSISGPWSTKPGITRGSDLTLDVTDFACGGDTTTPRIDVCKSLEHFPSPSPSPREWRRSSFGGIAEHHHSKYWYSPAKSPVAQPKPVRAHRRCHSINEIDGSLFEVAAANDDSDAASRGAEESGPALKQS